jgi:hypothetical protein
MHAISPVKGQARPRGNNKVTAELALHVSLPMSGSYLEATSDWDEGKSGQEGSRDL